jgi:hypothetical protein
MLDLVFNQNLMPLRRRVVGHQAVGQPVSGVQAARVRVQAACSCRSCPAPSSASNAVRDA